ncbi:PREDICTED: uncharacterized protein LOC109580356 [Amphimedon queenslandica]|uniref:Ubiquitin carboxyl-terminal hydrolase 47 C-terminal domain-containing protein n=1 Tax=Amphimedon queenslandica TaxID=400682 RepID=A0AAN0IWM3_AMPQE|nr:PREDICTED: uncharacterized protein LOC109580356 [Amphimedon queenslandica]|eukprot:XP_019848957.1 PREDICTED: uncharacterized protein LOC109580356 [Amphimedon queenslandica]
MGRAAGRVGHKIKFIYYKLTIQNYVMDLIVTNTQVGEFKKQIIEEAKVQGIDCVLELEKMRLHVKSGVSPGTVYFDHQNFYASQIYVEPLNEKMEYETQEQVYVIR